VLVTKEGGVVSAVGAKCPHFGAPLINGYYGNGTKGSSYLTFQVGCGALGMVLALAQLLATLKTFPPQKGS